ncbi:glycosyltransferase, partial [Enterococcus faecium]|nr:glycosyltransferase [Enterococcus faecium]
MKVSIVVTCLNEEKTVPLCFDEVEKFKVALAFAYLFFDDGSTD